MKVVLAVALLPYMLALIMACGTAEPTPSPASPSPAPAAPPPAGMRSGQIAFVSDRDGNPEIYLMDSDGSDVRRITEMRSTEAHPRWSPDGLKIAFSSDRDYNPATTFVPYQHEGAKLAFAGVRHAGFDVYAMNADGSDIARLTTENPADDLTPSWSPEGGRIAFSSDRSDDPRALIGPQHIYAMSADGSGLVNLTPDTRSGDFEPFWSPDGTKIAFTSNRDGNLEIYFMNAEGSSPTRLTSHQEFDFEPAWSPDGTKIAFTSFRDGNLEIYAMNADGSGLMRLTNHEASDSEPVWSPDGSKIAFSSDRDGNMEIYVMDADGANATRLTDNPALDSQPSW